MNINHIKNDIEGYSDILEKAIDVHNSIRKECPNHLVSELPKGILDARRASRKEVVDAYENYKRTRHLLMSQKPK